MTTRISNRNRNGALEGGKGEDGVLVRRVRSEERAACCQEEEVIRIEEEEEEEVY
jgi:hypothetical protein